MVRLVRLVRVIALPIRATVFLIREFREAFRLSRREGIDVSEALERRSAELQVEADQEADRKEWRRRLFEGMPPPP